MLRKSLVFLVIILMPILSWSFPSDCNFADTIVITDADISPTSTPLTLTSNNLYVLVGHVYVEDGTELIIEPGTVIWGTNPNDPTYGPTVDDPGALIVARGGLIHAEGTFNDPIIFTAVNDNVCDPDDLSYDDFGLWGGVIVCGYADLNTADSTGEIEGIPAGTALGRATYGHEPGIDDDSSGVMAYISLRHGGHEIGTANEINGFTFGAVGSKTVIHHLEVFANQDDGIEWFGGNFNAKYLVSAYNDDDCFDHDEGIRGKLQYLFAMYTDSRGDKNGEHDGGTDPECGTPFAHFEMYNATWIGRGTANACNGKSSSFHIRDNWGGEYKNSIFTEPNCWSFYEIENLDADYADMDGSCDSEQRLREGDIVFEYNMFYQSGNASIEPLDYVNPTPDKQGYLHIGAYFADTAYDGSAGFYNNHSGPTNTFGADPQLMSIVWDETTDGGLDLNLQATSPAKGGALSSYDDPFFDDVDYKGAFDSNDDTDPCNNWLAYWTYLYEKNIVPQQAPFIAGDPNGSGTVNILDITYTIAYLYQAGPAPVNWMKAGDANGNGSVNILDITYLIAFLYQSGPAPVGC